MSLLHVSCFVRDLEIQTVAGFIRVKSFWWRGTADRWNEPRHGHIQTRFWGLLLMSIKRVLGSIQLTQRMIYRLLHHQIEPVNNDIKNK
jgi:hypothetical protein